MNKYYLLNISIYTRGISDTYLTGYLLDVVKLNIKRLDKIIRYAEHSGLKRALKDLTAVCAEIRNKYRNYLPVRPLLL